MCIGKINTKLPLLIGILWEIIEYLMITNEPIRQFSPTFTLLSSIELFPTFEFFPILTFLPIWAFELTIDFLSIFIIMIYPYLQLMQEK